MGSDGGLYQGLLETIGNRSLPARFGKCISGGTLARVDTESFRSALPFPHIVLDEFLTPGYCKELLDEFPPFHPEYAVDENYAIGGKATHNDIRSIGPAYLKLDELIQTRAFLDLMSTITGIPDLLYDPDYLGGGTHENLDRQSLDSHVDFNYHYIRRWHRRINLILFLNEQWEDDWGGCLELSESPEQEAEVRVLPLFNRAVIFETNEVSWHGFPKVTLPPGSGISRKSIALYFYTKDRPADELAPARSTVYVEENLPDHIDEGHTLDADDMATLRSLIDRRDSHIARLYQHERDLTAKVFQLEGQGRERLKHHVRTFAGRVIRKTRRVAHKLLRRPEPKKTLDLPYIQFAQERARRHLVSGWGAAEASMVWSTGPSSVLEFDLRQPESLSLHFECRPFTYPNAPEQSIRVILNDVELEKVALPPGKRTYCVPVDKPHMRVGTNTLRFEYGHAISPKEAGTGDDDRILTVAWFNLWLSTR